LVRRAASLQLTADAKPPVAHLPTALMRHLGLKLGDEVRVTQGLAAAVLAVREDSTLAANTVRVAAGHADTAALGAMFGPLAVEPV
jgi:NADH-quinone oxidoreductase subunit G